MTDDTQRTYTQAELDAAVAAAVAKLDEALRSIVAASEMHPVHLEQAIGRARRLLTPTTTD